MITTFKKLKQAGIRKKEWDKLRQYRKFTTVYEEVHIKEILDCCGIKVAIWSLRVFELHELFPLLIRLNYLALKVFEAHSEDNRPKMAYYGLKRYSKGQITEDKFIGLLDRAEQTAKESNTDICWAAASALALTKSWDDTGFTGCDVCLSVARCLGWQKGKDIWLKPIKNIIKNL